MTAAGRGQRHVFDTMGTTVSLVFAGSAPAGALDAVEAVFAALNRRFSRYRDDSEASAVARGDLAVADSSPQFREAFALAEQWRADTLGAFTPYRPDGSIDLAGVIKAQAILDAGDALRRHGATAWCLNAGGDVLTSGAQADGRPWVVGIVDPTDRTALISQFTCSAVHPAVATSGVAERGEHIWRAGDVASTSSVTAAPSSPTSPAWLPGSTETAEDRLVQVTVAGRDIMTADVLATAILAGGRRTLEHALVRWDIEVLACSAAGEFLATEAFRAAD